MSDCDEGESPTIAETKLSTDLRYGPCMHRGNSGARGYLQFSTPCAQCDARFGDTEEKPMSKLEEKIDPKHYKTLKPEPIEVIEGWSLGFCLGNCVKYISRAGKKASETELEDLEKSLWYLKRHIEYVKSKGVK